MCNAPQAPRPSAHHRQPRGDHPRPPARRPPWAPRLALPLALLGGPAAAEEPAVFISAGFLQTFSWGVFDGHGPGLEVSLPIFPDGHTPAGFGPLAQISWLGDDRPRVVAGFELIGPFLGLEVAWSDRLIENQSVQGVHLGPFISFALVSVGGRFVVPVTGSAFEAGLSLSLKLPWLLSGDPGFLNFGGHGRPLRCDGRPVRAPLRVGARRRADPGLSPALRQALAAAWLRDAHAEHASVANFRLIARQVADHGGPEALVQALHRAAADEADHARRCFDVAGRLLGRHLTADPVPVPVGPPPSLATLAAESLREGCLGEAVAAESLRRAHPHAVSPIAEHLGAIARDEARHARLAHHLVRWAEGVGGARVTVAVRAERARLPWAAQPSPEPEGPLARAWGRLPEAGQRAAFAQVRAGL